MHDAVTLMLERRIGCLPVVRGNRLIGLVSESDCLALLARLLQPDAAARDVTGGTP
jgi:CBS domain-containing protein